MCLLPKVVKRKCPSNVDVAKLKAEFYNIITIPMVYPSCSKLIANFTASAKLGAIGSLIQFVSKLIRWYYKKLSGFCNKTQHAHV